MVLCNKVYEIIIKLLKKEPGFMEIIPIKDISTSIKFNDIVNIWKCFKKYDSFYIDNYSDFGLMLNDIFKENIDYSKFKFKKKKTMTIILLIINYILIIII